MYSGDHIVLSSLYALVCARRCKLPLVPLTGGLVALNALDLDHLLYGRLDNGAANSLTLHPLHTYAGCMLLLLTLCGLYKPAWIQGLFIVIGGYALHLAADALAFAYGYQIKYQLAFTFVALGLLMFLVRRGLRSARGTAFSCLIAGLMLVCHMEQAWIVYGLGLKPLDHPTLTYLNGGLLPLLAGLVIYAAFRHKPLAFLDPAQAPAAER